MNKYLLLSAAAALATTGANAGSAIHSFQFGTAGGGSYCDGGTAYTSGGGVWSWQHTNNNCASGVSYGQGLVGKGLAFIGKGADMSDNLFAKNYGSYYIYVNFQLPKKIQAGKKWTLTVGFSGTTSFLGNSGVLINVAPKGKATSTKGTVTNLKSLMKVRQAARAHKA